MDYKVIKFKISENIAFVTINRPDAMNALNTQVFNEMDDVVAQVSSNADVRVMIITGEGKAFVAGADIAEMVNKNQKEGS
ncbi:MAG: enoyl-CoA hydratase/isomerase family protein, partial [Bacteroidetes bacterium]|nr:enoyl-CoA hydratase/isomerase family protein [Bacteroidota bacterium]